MSDLAAMHTATPASSAQPPARGIGPLPGLGVELPDAQSGVTLAREPVRWSDLRDCAGELWLNEVLRRGRPGETLEPGSLSVRPRPGLHGETGFRLSGRCGIEVAVEFGAGALQLVAHRAALRLVEAGRLAPTAAYHYRVCADAHAPPARADTARSGFRIVRRALPASPAYLAVDLPRLLASASLSDPGHAAPEDFPVVFLRRAFEAAEDQSRRGGNRPEPVETGCGLVGVLVACRTTGEFGVVVVDALDVSAAEQGPYSLAFTAESWAHIQGDIDRRRADPATRLHRLAGTAHGHNFSPDPEGDRCAECPIREACIVSTTWISTADRTFMNSVFCGQPWQLALIFGHTARGDQESALYALRGGALHRRSFHLVNEEQLDDELHNGLGLEPGGGDA